MLEMLSIVDLRFLLMVLLGSVAGLFVGAIPGLSVSMATALLVSITYTWDHSDALAMIMRELVVGVFSRGVYKIIIILQTNISFILHNGRSLLFRAKLN